MANLECRFMAPDQQKTVGNLDLIEIPGKEGRAGILPDHAPMVIALDKGIVRLHRRTTVFQNYFIEGGFAKVSADACSITCQNFVLLDELDPKILEEEIKRYHDDLVGLTIEEECRALQAKILLTEAMLEAWKKRN